VAARAQRVAQAVQQVAIVVDEQDVPHAANHASMSVADAGTGPLAVRHVGCCNRKRCDLTASVIDRYGAQLNRSRAGAGDCSHTSGRPDGEILAHEMSEREVAVGPVVYVSHAGDEDSKHVRALLEDALHEAGHRVLYEIPSVNGVTPAGRRKELDPDSAAVVIVSPTALESESVRRDVAALADRESTEPGFRIVALPTLEVDVRDIAGSPLAALAGHEVPPGPSIDWRIQQVLWRLAPPSEDGRPAAKGAATAEGEALAVLRGHVGRVNGVAVAHVAGTDVIVSAGSDGTVRLWDAVSAAQVGELHGHSGSVTAVVVGQHRGKEIAVSCGVDQTVRLWDLEQRDPLWWSSHKGHTDSVTAVAIGGLGERNVVVSASADNTVRVWDRLAAGEPRVRTLPGHGRDIWSVAIGKGERHMIVSAGGDGTLHRWELTGDDVGESLVGHEATAWSVAVGQAGERQIIVSGSADGTVRRWDAMSGKPFGEPIAADAGPVRAVAIGRAHARDLIASGGSDTMVRLHDAQTGRAFGEPLAGHTSVIQAVAIGHAGGHPVVVSASDDGTIRIWDIPETAAATPAPSARRQLDERDEWISDAPAQKDLLNRRALAAHLATRLERLRCDEPGTSFLIHIDGPRGSGKTTLLEFLRDELGEEWLFVWFDAWREQRVGPPWWALLASLLDAVSADRGGRSARLILRFAEAWQRAPRPLLLGWTVLLVVLLCTLFVLPVGLDLGGAQQVVASLTVLLVAAGAAVGALSTLIRFVHWDSAARARVFEQSHRDPMERLADHFGWLIARAGKPVVFFIDDLDRCDPAHVVDVLDSIQTLVRRASRSGAAMEDQRAAYVVVAADGRWLRNSYEQEHEASSGAVAEPGRPLGYLFLDKIFQLTFEVPTMSRPLQAAYLRGLLRWSNTHGSGAGAGLGERTSVEDRVKRSTTEAETLAAYESASPEVRAEVAPVVVAQLAQPRQQCETEHALRKFAPLLDPNPRAMKRFVNAYGIARALQVVQDSVVARDDLALWTILRVRWPALAEYVRTCPAAIDALIDRRPPPDGAPSALVGLFASPDVADLLDAELGGPLTAATIRACCGLAEAPADSDPEQT
jgi:WD40 repeat protein